MTLEKAKKIIKSECYIADLLNLDRTRMVNTALDTVIEAAEQTRWIPVSERLPENHDDVLVWFEYIKDDYDCAWWGLAYYSLQYKKWIVSTNDRNPIVKAWMPLPQPYKAEGSDKNE